MIAKYRCTCRRKSLVDLAALRVWPPMDLGDRLATHAVFTCTCGSTTTVLYAETLTAQAAE